MKHSILNQQHLNHHNIKVTVCLIPDTAAEAAAIRNVEVAEASEHERELIDNYLTFNLGIGNYSIVSLLNQKGAIFEITVFKN